ncbi:hypothetical protein PILCRDRAFT_826264 [Piloderma croceum F 1598]|uniref:Uncharacterized protein n=1 Tax=Piloderma croceum (strain F 1598) TaxID=765440 RepID=A0A0C3ARC7_PILCF|nr:hypothetical protein PILCRDRAFT_826264 [Piloderma croceum F 1598]
MSIVFCCGVTMFGSPPSPPFPVPYSRSKLCSLKLTTTHVLTSATWHIVVTVALAQSTLKTRPCGLPKSTMPDWL